MIKREIFTFRPQEDIITYINLHSQIKLSRNKIQFLIENKAVCIQLLDEHHKIIGLLVIYSIPCKICNDVKIVALTYFYHLNYAYKSEKSKLLDMYNKWTYGNFQNGYIITSDLESQPIYSYIVPLNIAKCASLGIKKDDVILFPVHRGNNFRFSPNLADWKKWFNHFNVLNTTEYPIIYEATEMELFSCRRSLHIIHIIYYETNIGDVLKYIMNIKGIENMDCVIFHSFEDISGLYKITQYTNLLMSSIPIL